MTPHETIQQFLDQSQAREERATPGPWITGSIPWKVWTNGGHNTVCDVQACGDAVPVAPGLATSDSMAANRDFIAASRTESRKLREALRLAIASVAEVAELWTGEQDCAAKGCVDALSAIAAILNK